MQRIGLISELDTLVIRSSLAQLRSWHQAGHGQLRLSVNLSRSDLFHQALIQLLEEHAELLPHLTLELTEESLMHCTDAELSVIRRLKERAARLAIDDFGTGYASLRYLHQLPVDEIKIDRSFVRNLPDNEQDRRLITLMRQIIDTFGFLAVVEGVENEAQREFFCQQKLHTLQGFLYSPPLPADQFEQRFLSR